MQNKAKRGTSAHVEMSPRRVKLQSTLVTPLRGATSPLGALRPDAGAGDQAREAQSAGSARGTAERMPRERSGVSGFSVSVVIPVRNGAATIAACLKAALASRYHDFEVIVVDDGSADGTAEIAGRYACTLIRLPTSAGASRARNVGAFHAKGEILFFTDADCLLCENTLAAAVERLTSANRNTVIGGTYTASPGDAGFFNAFQSVFVNFSEGRGLGSGRDSGDADYIAAHAMAIHAQTFRESGGFTEHYLPILEDVDFSHRLRRSGYELLMDAGIQVRHLFNFSLLGSIRNGFRKSKFWTIYSLHNRDLLADSGTASHGLKLNVAILFGSILALLLTIGRGSLEPAIAVCLLMALNILVNRGLIAAFHRTGGLAFAISATVYYLLLYPLTVGMGAIAGALSYRRYAPLLEVAG